MSSTGTINGRPVALYRLPIVEDGSQDTEDTSARTFQTTSFVAALQKEIEGDGFFQVLKSDLEAGHEIQRVMLETAGLESPRYIFLLARQGVTTTREVPAGGLAIENLLLRRRQRLFSLTDESRRAALHLDRACQPFAVFGRPTMMVTLRTLATRFGGQRGSQATSDPLEEELAIQGASEALLQVLETAVRTLVAHLCLDLEYNFDQARTIADRALATIIGTGAQDPRSSGSSN